MSSSTILTGEEEEEGGYRRPSEGGTPTHSHRRRWSIPDDSGGEPLHDNNFAVRSLADHECSEHQGVSLADLDLSFSCSSSDNSQSFYLGGEISSSEPPLLLESRTIALPEMTKVRRRGRSVTRKRDLPPLLTTLDCNGRPRFQHRRVRSEGRLEIASVAVDSPEIVSVRGREGLKIGTVREDDDGQQNHSSSSPLSFC